jgi:hypothetical protein
MIFTELATARQQELLAVAHEHRLARLALLARQQRGCAPMAGTGGLRRRSRATGPRVGLERLIAGHQRSARRVRSLLTVPRRPRSGRRQICSQAPTDA